VSKVVVVGVDGLSPILVRRWKEHLPNLKRIMEKGASGILESTMPPTTCPAWNCFSTGKNPGKIGIFGFVQLSEEGIPEIVNPTMCDSPTIWEILSEYGKRVGVLNVPGTYPPARVNGFMVSGFLTPRSKKDFTFPTGLRDELDKVVNGYEIEPLTFNPESMRGGNKAYLKEIERVYLKRLVATKYLMKRFDWDFFMVVFRATDYVQHFFWHYMDPKSPRYESDRKYRDVIREWYARIDQAIGQISEIAGEDTFLIIMSDHGFGRFHSFFLINEWLRQQGFLKLIQEDRAVEPIDRSRMVTLRRFAFRIIGAGLIGRLAKIIPTSLLTRVTILGMERQDIDEIMSQVDWSKTKAFAISGLAGMIYLGLGGAGLRRSAKTGKDYEEIRDEIMNKLYRGIHAGKGSKVSVSAYKKEEIYDGKHLDKAPDILCRISVDGAICNFYAGFSRGELWRPFTGWVTGTHAREGVWMITGPGVRENIRIDAQITDLCPTILRLLRVPIPPDMDGKILTQAFSPTINAAHEDRP